MLQAKVSCVFKHDRKENLEKHVVVSVLLHNYQHVSGQQLSTAGWLPKVETIAPCPLQWEKWLNSSWGNQAAPMCCLRDNDIQQLGCLRFAWSSLIKFYQTEVKTVGMVPWFFVLLIRPLDRLHLFYVVVLVLNFFRKYRLEQKNLALPHLLKYSI